MTHREYLVALALWFAISGSSAQHPTFFKLPRPNARIASPRATRSDRILTRASGTIAFSSSSSESETSRPPSMQSFRPVDYDKAISTFSPSGELLQVRYAQRATERGTASVALALDCGSIVVCTPSPLMDGLLDRNNSEGKLWAINRLSCATFSGLAGDGLALVRESRRHSSAFESAYECVPSPRSLAAKIGEEQHEATIRGGKRPMAASVVLIGFEDIAEAKPEIYLCDPSGTVSQWRAVAVGQKSGALMRFLERRFKPDMRLIDAIDLALDTVRKGVSAPPNHNNNRSPSDASSRASGTDGRGRRDDDDDDDEEEEEGDLADVFIIQRSGSASSSTYRIDDTTVRLEGTADADWRPARRSLRIKRFLRMGRLSQSMMDEISREDAGITDE